MGSLCITLLYRFKRTIASLTSRCFQGEVKKVGVHKYETYGRGDKINNTTIAITELPIHKWTNGFKTELEALCGEKGDGVIKVGHFSRRMNLGD